MTGTSCAKPRSRHLAAQTKIAGTFTWVNKTKNIKIGGRGPTCSIGSAHATAETARSQHGQVRRMSKRMDAAEEERQVTIVTDGESTCEARVGRPV